MSRRRVVEETVSHDRWLVSYADFITLLFAFFVVMYSISQVNEGKYKVLSETLTGVFGKDVLSVPERVIDPFQVGEVAQSNPLNVIELGSNAVLNIPSEEQQQDQPGELDQSGRGQQQGLPAELQQINDQIDEAFEQLLQDQQITVRGNEEWLEVELKSSLLFSSGDAVLGPAAVELLGSIANILGGQSNPVRVEGFTDSIPINTGQFPSNWELSTSRAAAVVKLFVEEGLAADRFAAIGYGQYQPIADNDTAEGRAANRRVVLMISKTGELRPQLRQLTSTEELLQQGQPGIGIIIPGVNDQQTQPPVTGNNAAPVMRTIELEDGGLLFTNDAPAEQSP